MIYALVGWAVESWNVVTSKALMVGLVPHCAPRLGQLDPLTFLAFLEAVVCESEEGAQQIQRLYDEAKPAPPVSRGESRREELARIMNLGGG